MKSSFGLVRSRTFHIAQARPDDAEVLGPVRVDEGEDRVVVRVPRAQGGALSRALGEVQRVRSGRKLDAVRIRVDPGSL